MERGPRIIVGLLGLGLVVALARKQHPAERTREEACGGAPITSVEERDVLKVAGFTINERYNCIDKRSFDTLGKGRAVAPRDVPAAQPEASAVDGASLAEARRGVSTTLGQRSSNPTSLPTPPAAVFVRTDYASTAGLVLPAFVTPDPRDGQKHPAIVWLTGGDTNTLDDFWTPRPESNDQSASAFRKAGVVMMFPTLRGGNTNAGNKEYFFGEIDDVLAAADQLARQPYVDASQIYLGGHSTGGTLALLTAEASGRFKAVFAFGPVATIDRYPESLVPLQFGGQGDPERRLRSPIYWLKGISSPTYLIEGRNRPGNAGDVEELCSRSRNALVRCILADGSDHFSVLAKVSRVIAARITVANAFEFSLRPEEFAAQRR